MLYKNKRKLFFKENMESEKVENKVQASEISFRSRKKQPPLLLTKSVDLIDAKSILKMKESHKSSEHHGSIDLTELSRSPSPIVSYCTFSSSSSSNLTFSTLSKSPFCPQKPTKLDLKCQVLPTNRPFSNMPHVLTSPSDAQEEKIELISNKSELSPNITYQSKPAKSMKLYSTSPTLLSPKLVQSRHSSPKTIPSLNQQVFESPINFSHNNVYRQQLNRLQSPYQRAPVSFNRFFLPRHQLTSLEPRAFLHVPRSKLLLRRPLGPFSRPPIRQRPLLRMSAEPGVLQPRSIIPFCRRAPPFHQTPEHYLHRHIQLQEPSHRTNSLPRSFKQIDVLPSPLLQQEFQEQFQQKTPEEASDSDDDDWC